MKNPEEQFKPSVLGGQDEVNLHSISAERKEFRKARREVAGTPLETAVKAKLDKKEEETRQQTQGLIERLGGISAVKERLKEDKAIAEKNAKNEWFDQDSIDRELGSVYGQLNKLREDFAVISQFELRKMREARTNPRTARVYTGIQDDILTVKNELKEQEKEIEDADSVMVKAADILEYRRGLFEEGHIAHTPTVERYIKEIGVRMISSKPMFLHGPTGTGKTSLARYASQHFTGERAEMIYCNPQTRESSIWGKTGLDVKDGAPITIDVYGPLARAMKEGRIAIFDEFTALPQEQMVFIKGVLNAKVGDKVNVMGNGVVEIAPGFQMIFTANLKSEKNRERQELPPEIAREFEQNNLEIGYTPKEEAHDIALARLMNPDGSLDMSYEDLNTTIPRFLEAMEEVQIAYTDRANENTARLTGTMDSSGNRPGLKKFVFTQSTIEAIIDGWKTEKTQRGSLSFAEFLDRRLVTALTFKEYPESDRILVAKILAAKGLLRTVEAKDMGLPEAVFAFDAAKRQRGGKEQVEKIIAESRKERHISLRELATLDPFDTRKMAAEKAALEFLDPKEREAHETFGRQEVTEARLRAEFDGFLLDTYKGWNVDANKLSQIKFRVEPINPANIDYAAKKADIDTSKFGEYLVNPDTAGIDWSQVLKEKIKVVDLSAMVGQPLDVVAKHIVDTYGNRYYIPGLEYYKYILEHPDQAPDDLQHGNYHFMFGSLFRGSDGGWSVPYVYWAGSEWGRDGRWLDRGWRGAFRVVLLEK